VTATLPPPATTAAATGPAPPRPSAPGRIAGPRRGRVPSGRALLGALLVTLAGLALFAVYLSASSGPSGRYVVAAAALAPGTELTADDLDVITGDLPTEVADRAFTEIDDVVGMVTVGPLAAGELVQDSAVGSDPEPDRAGYTISFAIDTDRASGGRLEPGQRVTILVTYTGAQEAVTEVVAEDATVISFDQAGDAALDALDETMLTVRLPASANPLAVAHAARVGEITVIDPTFAGDTPLPPEFQPDVPAGAGNDAGDAGNGDGGGDQGG
jgi:Flp pilus assembly protein CpaB